MAELRALIFDVDGTLADTERDGHRIAFNRAFRKSGLSWEWTPERYGRLLRVPGGKERLRHYIEQYQPPFERPHDLEAFIAELHRRKTRYFIQMLQQGAIALRPGVERLLREAHSIGLSLNIATTTASENVIALLASNLDTEAPEWFDVIAADEAVSAKKPAPDVYLYVLRSLGFAPEECIAFEDSDNGLRAARVAGVATIVTVSDYTREQNFDGALVVLDQFGEPERPFRVLQGDVGGARYLDLGLVRRLWAGSGVDH